MTERERAQLEIMIDDYGLGVVFEEIARYVNEKNAVEQTSTRRDGSTNRRDPLFQAIDRLHA